MVCTAKLQSCSRKEGRKRRRHSSVFVLGIALKVDFVFRKATLFFVQILKGEKVKKKEGKSLSLESFNQGGQGCHFGVILGVKGVILLGRNIPN